MRNPWPACNHASNSPDCPFTTTSLLARTPAALEEHHHDDHRLSYAKGLNAGLIGPVLAGATLLALLPEIAGLGLDHWRTHARHYLLALAIFLLPTCTWVFMLYHHGGSSLLNFWLVDNQLRAYP